MAFQTSFAPEPDSPVEERGFEPSVPSREGVTSFSRTRRAGDRLVSATGLRLTRTAPMEERIGQQLPASLALLLVIPAEMLADRRTIELDPENETVG